MKRIKQFIKSNVKVIFTFILGGIICGGGVYAATLFASDQVLYTESDTLKAALDDLYSKAKYGNATAEDIKEGKTALVGGKKITGTGGSSMTILDGVGKLGLSANATGTIFANSNGVCIPRRGKISCFKINNWDVEKTHLQQVFSDVSCTVDSTIADCVGEDFECDTAPSGYARCVETVSRSGCIARNNAVTTCY